MFMFYLADLIAQLTITVQVGVILNSSERVLWHEDSRETTISNHLSLCMCKSYLNSSRNIHGAFAGLIISWPHISFWTFKTFREWRLLIQIPRVLPLHVRTQCRSHLFDSLMPLLVTSVHLFVITWRQKTMTMKRWYPWMVPSKGMIRHRRTGRYASIHHWLWRTKMPRSLCEILAVKVEPHSYISLWSPAAMRQRMDVHPYQHCLLLFMWLAFFTFASSYVVVSIIRWLSDSCCPLHSFGLVIFSLNVVQMLILCPVCAEM